MEIIAGLLLGWPAITACLIVAGIGLFKKDHRYLLASGIIAIPFTWFLSGFPQMKSIIFLAPLLLFISAWTMSHKWEMASWLFALPFFLIILLFIDYVLRMG